MSQDSKGEQVRLQAAYRTKMEEYFPSRLTITLDGEAWDGNKVVVCEPKTLVYKKVTWQIPDEKGGSLEQGLRYGENPGQQAALYRLEYGNLALGDVQTIQPGRWLASNVELLQSGKHPGKTNITDADNALNILRYFSDEPVVAIMKHNNPCGVAIGRSLLEAYIKANNADRVAAFGGAIAFNRPLDRETAEEVVKHYSEVVVAPEFEEGVMETLGKKKDIRVMKIGNMGRLKEWVGAAVLDFKSLMDGGLVLQTSYIPKAATLDDVKALPLGYHDVKGDMHQIARTPTEQEYKDMWFGWLVESGVSSNSVLFVKDGATVSIGTGQQDRQIVAKIAVFKAYENARNNLSLDLTKLPYNKLLLEMQDETETARYKELRRIKQDIGRLVESDHGNLEGSVMVSDAFFPFRDGVDVGLKEGITAVIQPGGSGRDYESIDACNEKKATMVFTGQRSFKH